ncbi:MAG TPA: hypothetical protein VJX48_05640 [Xanthobacteraceae bacterium]|nr:hypothetical protein [Xanthobacteraceae bacterium]
MSQSRLSQFRIFFERFPASSVAKLALMAALLPVTVRADILPYGGKRPERPTPAPLILVKGPEILEKIHKAGFDCAGLNDVLEQAQPGVDPATYEAQHLMPLMVTCQNGKRFFVTLPFTSEDAGGEVLSLD